jgi:hypothetical protein
MKKNLWLLTITILSLALTPVFAQFGRTPSGPDFAGPTAKLFGEQSTFTATLEFQSAQSSGEAITMPGKIVFDSGKSRFEMNMSEAKGMKMPPSAVAQLKSMGMDTMCSISRPDLKLNYIIYPGLHSYVAKFPAAAVASAAGTDYKITTTELGKETVEGHDCIKNKVVVTDKAGTPHESTVWNATDLNKFPVKITTTENGQSSTMLFKNISFEKPDAGSFEPPADFTKYDNMQVMMQTEMMKKMGGNFPHP